MAFRVPSLSSSRRLALVVGLAIALGLSSPAPVSAAAAAAAPTAGPSAADCAGSTFAAPLSRACTAFEAWSGVAPPRARCPCPGRSALAPTKTFSLTVSSLKVNNAALAAGGPGATKTYVCANGTVPGPAIVVDEGDWVEVTVFNALNVDPTTLHWHGMLQVLTPFSDGVPSLTQCAIPPGGSMTYSFRASNAGTYWCVRRDRER